MRVVRTFVGRAFLACLIAVVSTACGSSSPAAPAPTPAPVPAATALRIVGTTILTAGLTSQLTANTLNGTTASGVAWTSATPAIATVSSTGLVTALAEGTSVITAAAPSINARGQVTVLVEHEVGSTVALTACTNITSPGRYVVDRDLPTPSPCFSIQHVANVQLDCQGHSMLAIVLDQVSHATVTNCIVAANIKMTSVDDVTVSGSTITNGILWAVQSTNVVFRGNTLRSTGTGLGELIALDRGSNNRVAGNTLIGGYDGGRANVGTDDAIVIYNERGDVVEDNTISNFYDAGIESVGALADTRLTNNTMTNLGVAGVATYWCSAWTNNVVQGNSVSTAPWLVRIFYVTGSLCSGPIVPAAFSGNQFIANVFRNPAQGTGLSLPPAISIAMPGLVENNLIQDNDMGTANAPFLSPIEGFIDGGGNVCAPANPPLFNFTCGPRTAFTLSSRSADRRAAPVSRAPTTRARRR